METIKPDKDDLLAHRRKTESGKAKSPRSPQPPRPPRRQKLPWLLLLIVVLAAAGAIWWGGQRIAALHQEMADTQSMIKESRLSLARFEGKLTQTGQTVQKNDNSVSKTLDKHSHQIKTLWHVVEDTNAKAIADHQAAIDKLHKQGQTIERRLDSDGKALNDLKSSVSGNDKQLRQQGQNLDDLKQNLGQVQTDLNGKLQRMGQEQQLANQDVQARLDKLAQQLQGMNDLSKRLDKLNGQLKQLHQDIQSIDAARAQVNSRLLNLDHRVDRLTARVSSSGKSKASQ